MKTPHNPIKIRIYPNINKLIATLNLINITTVFSLLNKTFAPNQNISQPIDLFMSNHVILWYMQGFCSIIIIALLAYNFKKLYLLKKEENIQSKDITPVVEEVIEYNENQKDNSFLFHKIHNKTLAYKNKK